MTQHLEALPLSPGLGAEIRGVDLRDRLSDETVATMRKTLLDYELLIFRNQAISSEQQVAFGRQFGEPTIHPFSPNLAELPELIILDNHKDNPPRLSDQWHSDETFRADPPMGTILKSVI